jgi:hypothetical protein
LNPQRKSTQPILRQAIAKISTPRALQMRCTTATRIVRSWLRSTRICAGSSQRGTSFLITSDRQSWCWLAHKYSESDRIEPATSWSRTHRDEQRNSDHDKPLQQLPAFYIVHTLRSIPRDSLPLVQGWCKAATSLFRFSRCRILVKLMMVRESTGTIKEGYVPEDQQSGSDCWQHEPRPNRQVRPNPTQ